MMCSICGKEVDASELLVAAPGSKTGHRNCVSAMKGGFAEFTCGPMGKRFAVRPSMVLAVLERGMEDFREKDWHVTRLMVNRAVWDGDAKMEDDDDVPGGEKKVWRGQFEQVLVRETYEEVMRRLGEVGR